MKKFYLAAGVLFFVLTGLTIYFFNPDACMAKEFDASINVMGYDRNVTIKINDVLLSRITGGQSQSLRLFLTNDPTIKALPPARQQQMKELFCLKEGENTIEIAFSEKGKPKSPSSLTVSIDSENYKVPVLKYSKSPDIKEGRAKGVFKIYTDAPAGFTTVILQ